MRTLSVKPFFLFFILVVGTQSVSLGQGQDSTAVGNTTNEGEIRDISIEIRKEKQLELSQAVREFDKMSLLGKKEIDTSQKYRFVLSEYDLPVIEPDVLAATMPLPPLKPLTGNYFKVGFGNYLSPYLEGFLNTTRHQRKNYGVHFKHASSINGPVDDENSGTSINQIDAYGRLFVPSGEFNLELGADRRMVNYFGYEQPLAENQEVIKQIYQKYNIGGGYRFYVPNNLLEFDVNASFSFFQNETEAQELNGKLEGEARYEIKENAKISVGAKAIYNTFEQGNFKQDRHIFSLHPSYQTFTDMFHLEAGVELVYSADTTSKSSKLFLYPKIKAELDLIENNLSAYASAEGDLRQVTVSSMSEINPFLSTSFVPVHTNEQLKLNLGLRAKPSEKFGLRAGLSYQLVQNLAFFVNDYSKFSRELLAVYDPETIGVFSILADVSANFDKLHTALITRFDSYATETVDEAWHRPTFSAQFNATYQWNYKWYFYSELYFLQGIQAPEIDNNGAVNAVDLDAITDLNLRIEYRVKEKLTAFVQGKNLLGAEYERYRYYLNRGLQVMGGVTYTF